MQVLCRQLLTFKFCFWNFMEYFLTIFYPWLVESMDAEYIDQRANCTSFNPRSYYHHPHFIDEEETRIQRSYITCPHVTQLVRSRRVMQTSPGSRPMLSTTSLPASPPGRHCGPSRATQPPGLHCCSTELSSPRASQPQPPPPPPTPTAVCMASTIA